MLNPDPLDDPVAPVAEAVQVNDVPPTALFNEIEVKVPEQMVVAPVVVTFGVGFTSTFIFNVLPGHPFAVG